jgi:polyphosphate glucokinase
MTTTAPRVLVLDVGGSHIKMLASGQRTSREFISGPSLSATGMVAGVREATADWAYDVISMGYPGPVIHGRIAAEPHNLKAGWVGFDFSAAFKRPIKIINDAAMQALGSYKSGAMLFLGFGTGLGSTMIVDGIIAPMELGHLPYRKATYEDYVGLRGLKRLGKKRWRRHVAEVTEKLIAALEPTDVVLGGGNVRLLKELPKGTRAVSNTNAFTGGFRLWKPLADTARRHATGTAGGIP